MSSNDQRLKKFLWKGNVDIIPVQLEKFGSRYTDYRKYYHAAGKQQYHGEFPLYVMFEQTFKCNLRCPSCLHAYPGEKSKYNTGVNVLPLKLYEKVILECEEYQCPSVAMHDCDEPLLVKDIAKRINIAKEHDIMDIMMTTNAQLMTKEIAQQICDAGITHILFSIDAATAMTYTKVRVGGVFGKVLDAISFINAWKEANQSILPITRASFVRSKNNMEEEDLFVETFQDKVNYIDIQSFYAINGLNASLVPENHQHVVSKSFICAEPFRKVIVRANGDVIPCCSLFAYSQVLGNVYNDTIYDIYNGEKANALRNSLKEKQFNSICRSCISNLYEPKQ